MDEIFAGDDGAAARGGTDVGTRLRTAREAAGLSLADVAQRTRVPLRHLAAIERGDYAALPSQTYAVGFARAYARAVGADEIAVAAEVRGALAGLPRVPDYEPYEPVDPARLPSRGLVILAAGAGLALLILAALWFSTDLMRTRGGGTSEPVPAPSASAASPTPAPSPSAAPTGGQVRLTANGEVWLRVYDADNKTLFLGTMKPGDHFDVPADAHDPMINVGRPDKLTVTLNGSAVAPLGDGSRPIKDVKVSGAAIAARLSGAPAPVGPSAVVPPPVAGVSSPEPVRHDEPHARKAPVMSDAQRANLEAATPPPTTGNTAP